MSLFTPSMRSPTCSSCTLRLMTSLMTPTRTPWTQQTRLKSSKKRSVKGPDHITVRLNHDVPGFGRKGSYVPISAGHMRNTWHRASIASYCTPLELRSLAVRNVNVQRDVLFMATSVVERRGLSKRRQAQIDAAVRAGGTITSSSSSTESSETDKEGREDLEPEVGAVAKVQVVKPQRALELLGVLVPHRLDFKRQVQEGGKAIFGSVSAGDVVERVREAMGENEEASRVVVGDDDVRFVHVKGENGQEGIVDRVKALGQYKVEIGVKGADGSVSRSVRVLAAEAQDATAN
ncbi:hypothetical protein CAC42_2596 [Sphaceloma murrayae]|uniref:Ribosomal protein L9 domain-containing protein n=1 Tax=Sphaceloma murrayae TaxID=2082308 RepID=A0A2K1QWM7_9PEZI|nr:hypothetical protein CAC42_2596 [Sphaceloma murrayae]